MRQSASSLLLLFVTLAVPARADLIVGQVVDDMGVGVPGVDIDVEDFDGKDVALFNDGTDANGFFSTTLPGPGVYRVFFFPPPPPATTHLVTDVADVVVVGTANMGAVALPPGVALSGRAVTEAALPVAGVNLDVIDETTGDSLLIVGGTTDAFGDFAVAVPTGPLEVRMKTAGVPLVVLAPKAFPLSPTADLDLGDIVLEPGFVVSGRVVDSANLPVEDADLDFRDSTTNERIYTPGDNTNEFGDFSVVVPAGSWIFDVCPLFSDSLAAYESSKTTIAANLAVPTITLEPGVVLSGIVRDPLGGTVAGADLDLKRMDGTPVMLCGDNTNGSGAYAVIVPTGRFRLEFEPPGFALPLGAVDLTATVSANTVLDATLPPCQPVVTKPGTRGAGGITPVLGTTGGAPRFGNSSFAFEVSSGRGGATAFVMLDGLVPPSPRGSLGLPGLRGSGRRSSVPGRVAVLGTVALNGAPGSPGAGTGSLGMPLDSNLIGTSMVVRALVVDPAAVGGMAQTNSLLVTFCE